jgi:hypothetical protein
LSVHGTYSNLDEATSSNFLFFSFSRNSIRSLATL